MGRPRGRAELLFLVSLPGPGQDLGAERAEAEAGAGAGCLGHSAWASLAAPGREPVCASEPRPVCAAAVSEGLCSLPCFLLVVRTSLSVPPIGYWTVTFRKLVLINASPSSSTPDPFPGGSQSDLCMHVLRISHSAITLSQSLYHQISQDHFASLCGFCYPEKHQVGQM